MGAKHGQFGFGKIKTLTKKKQEHKQLTKQNKTKPKKKTKDIKQIR